MANDIEQHVETIVKVTDQASGPMAKAAVHAERLTEKMHAATGAAKEHGGALQTLFHTLSGLGGLGVLGAGAFGFHAMLSSTEQYMDKVKQIRELTENTGKQSAATAGEIDYLFSAARRAGVPYESMNRTMFQLSRRGAMLEQTMAAAGQHVPGMAKKFERLGVVMDKGPVMAMTTMAAAAKKGKVDAGDLQAQFRVGAKDANDMLKFLKHMTKEELEQAKLGKGGYLKDEDIEAFDRMEEAQHRIKDTWNRIQVVVMKNLMPPAAKLAEQFSDRIEKTLPAIQNAMGLIAEHMDKIVASAKLWVSYMSAKAVWEKFDTFLGGEGVGKGLVKLAEKLGSIGGKGGPNALGKVGLAAGSGMITGLMTSGAGGKLGAGGVAALAQAASAFTVLVPVILGVAAAAAVLYLGLRTVEHNVRGIGDKIENVLDRIMSRAELLWEPVDKVIHGLTSLFMGGEGMGLLDAVGYLAAFSFDQLLEGFDTVMHVAQTLQVLIAEAFRYIWDSIKNPLAEFITWVQDQWRRLTTVVGTNFSKLMGWDSYDVKEESQLDKLSKVLSENFDKLKKDVASNTAIKTIADVWRRTDRDAKTRAASRKLGRELDAAAAAAEKSKNEKNFDFRGSHFDITQKFAEGFDPDRIAVAFADDLANLGEMRSQSGFAPALAAR